jgi:hypothetical protein
LLDVLALARRKVIEHNDLMAHTDEMLHEVRSDEPSTARHEKFQCVPSSSGEDERAGK